MAIHGKPSEFKCKTTEAGDESFLLSGKNILVTGACGQIGSDFCRAVGKAGAFVIVSDIEPRKCSAQVRNLRGMGIRAMWVRLDVSDPKSVEKAFRRLRREIGKLDVLVNAAAIAVFTPFEKRTHADFMKVLEVNLGGPFLCTQAAAEWMKKNKRGGSIINIASVYGLVSSDPRIYTDCSRVNSEVYSASKGGLVMMTRYLAVHLAPYKIRVNAISPGGVYRNHGKDFVERYSNRTPMGRMANVNEISDALLYLASDRSSYLTGHNLVVDGGLTAW